MLALNKKINIMNSEGQLIKSASLKDLHAEYIGRKLGRNDYGGDLVKCMETIWLNEPDGLEFVVPERAPNKTWQVGCQYVRASC